MSLRTAASWPSVQVPNFSSPSISLPGKSKVPPRSLFLAAARVAHAIASALASLHAARSASRWAAFVAALARPLARVAGEDLNTRLPSPLHLKHG